MKVKGLFGILSLDCQKAYDPLVISSAKDEKLIDIDGKEYIDLISSPGRVNIHDVQKRNY